MKYFLLIFALIILGGILYFGFFNKPLEYKTQEPSMKQELIIEDIKIGAGPEVKNSDTVSVNYIGTFSDGTKFDSSYDRGVPFSFTLGQGQVITGWDQGVLEMKVGGKRKLTIPPSLAYGETGIPGAIPPNSTLLFKIELLEIIK